MAQSIPHSMALQYSVNGVQVVSATVAVTDNENQMYVDAVATGVTNQPVNIAFAQAQLKGYILYSDQVLTIRTNSTTVPAPLITLAASAPQFWIAGNGGASLFTVDVTKFYLSNASGVTANVTMYFLIHGSV